MTKRRYVRYATKKRMEKVLDENVKAYERYIRTRTIRNPDTVDTTLKVYRSAFNIFLAFLSEEYDNPYILDEEFLEDDMLDVMEDFILFCQEELGNNKKNINFKISAISSFYHWAVRRGLIDKHPFDGRLERMEGADDEKILTEHFLTEEETDKITEEMLSVFNLDYQGEFDEIDAMIWLVSFDSACRIGALTHCRVDNVHFNDDNSGYFRDVREKRGKIVPIPFTPSTGTAIKWYMDSREQQGIDTPYLIPSFSDGEWGAMSAVSITRRVRFIGEFVGEEGFRPHSIRKSRLNQVAKIDIMLAQALGNHEDVSTTQRHYTERQDATDVMAKLMAMSKEKE